MIGVSLPDFWLALMLIILFSLKLGWLPAMGIGGVQYWIMPVISAAVAGIAMNARQTRSAVLETKRADFITTARAKGLREAIVIYKHLMPNALIPVINNLGTQFAVVIAGTVVIESVFSFPGVGLYLLSGISAGYPGMRPDTGGLCVTGCPDCGLNLCIYRSENQSTVCQYCGKERQGEVTWRRQRKRRADSVRL